MKTDTAKMKAFLRRQGISQKDYQYWNKQTVAEFMEANPTWTLKEWEALIKENFPCKT